jgi:hypothetical protein
MPAVAQRFSPSRPVNTLEVSTPIGIHDPPHPLMPAPLASLLQGRVGAAAWPQAIRAGVEVWLVERFQQPGHRSLAPLILARGLPQRPLTAVDRLQPDARARRGLRAAAA